MVLVFLWLASVLTLAEGYCRNLRYREKRQNQVLANHTIRTVQPIKNMDDCECLCYLEPLCFAVNFCVDLDSTGTCELTNSDHIRSGEDLKDKQGCTFYGTETACSSEPCQNNGICEGDFDYAVVPYRCLCPAGFSGQVCENDIDECAADSMNDCHENATCSNYQGGYDCTCKPGYHGNGKICNVQCNVSVPLGMEDGRIPDASITASSEWTNKHSAPRARLNIERITGSGPRGAWSAKTNDQKQWLQVDLSSITVITAIATQGRQDHDQWVTSYSLQNGSTDSYFDDYEGVKIFDANSDRNTIVKHVLPLYIIGRYIRVRPKTWNNHVSMRMELYGCK